MKKTTTTALLLGFLLYSNFLLAQKVDTKIMLNTFLDAWHKAAANADAVGYFGKMSDDAIYIGTDASEVWKKSEFEAFAKPYFDKGKAWDFTANSRNIYLDKKQKTAWFDENLKTWMGVCRGSGILKLTKDGWKIKHYVLSVTIHNDLIQEFIGLESLLPEKEITAVIKKLFKGMKTKDTDLVKTTFHENAQLHTVMEKDGKTILREEKVSGFIAVIGTPTKNTYDEKVVSYEVKIDGKMATVWTPYEFYVDDKFAHCGVNAFQLIKTKDGWKITQITDTRRKKGCKQ